MNRGELGQNIFRLAHRRGEFTLRSGSTSKEYFDKYSFEANPELLEEVAKALIELIPEDTEVVAGLELGGIPLAVLISQLTKLPTCFVRKEAKGYGTGLLAEGIDVGGKRVIIVEDIVTSGGQIIESVAELKRQGAIISTAVCVIDREAGGSENLSEAGIELRPVFKKSEIEGEF